MAVYAFPGPGGLDPVGLLVLRPKAGTPVDGKKESFRSEKGTDRVQSLPGGFQHVVVLQGDHRQECSASPPQPLLQESFARSGVPSGGTCLVPPNPHFF